MTFLLILTAIAATASFDKPARIQAAEELEEAIQEAEMAGLPALDVGLQRAIEVLGPDSEVAQEIQRLKNGAPFEAMLAGDDGAPWLIRQLPRVISDLRFEPILEADFPVGFPQWTPVGEVQIQHYPAYRMAQTAMGKSSPNRAFWKLFQHIQSHEISMTSPVETHYSTEEGGLSRSSMAFLYGSQEIGRTADDGVVEVIDVPAQEFVSVGVRGFDNGAKVAGACLQLETWLHEHPEWTVAGPPRTMVYNSPMVYGDRRYFEVQYPVQRTLNPVIDFSDREEAKRWRAVDDAVMGGRSASGLVSSAEGYGLFTGRVSLENNGGFASVRRSVAPGSLAGMRSIVVRVRGDGNTYQLRLRTEPEFNAPSYQCDFKTVPGEWIDVPLDFGDFVLKWRGRSVRGAEPLDAAAIRGMGLLIANKQEGPFRLELQAVLRPSS